MKTHYYNKEEAIIISYNNLNKMFTDIQKSTRHSDTHNLGKLKYHYYILDLSTVCRCIYSMYHSVQHL